MTARAPLERLFGTPRRRGVLEIADGGTLFLRNGDELSDEQLDLIKRTLGDGRLPTGPRQGRRVNVRTVVDCVVTRERHGMPNPASAAVASRIRAVTLKLPKCSSLLAAVYQHAATGQDHLPFLHCCKQIVVRRAVAYVLGDVGLRASH